MGLTLGRTASSLLVPFAHEVGAEGAVACVGGRTQWELGGSAAAGIREVKPPTGIVAHEPAEMIVRVRAGTSVAELQSALAERGQYVALEPPSPADAAVATVGGVLAVGRSGLRRLGRGPVRDCVLEVTAVSSRGELVRAGAPLVKNVTGFDLCRLFVGSFGTLAFLAEVVLRCRPLPEAESWWVGEEVDPFSVASSLFQPLAVLWDGARTWVGLAGYRVDVEEQARLVLGDRFASVDGPPPAPTDVRTSVRPAALRRLGTRGGLAGRWLAEVGVGVVHSSEPWPAALLDGAPAPDPGVVRLNRAVKAAFDPTGRLNPGRSALSALVGASAP